ncbi:diacylglycerol kinase [Sulfurimonas sp.]
MKLNKPKHNLYKNTIYALEGFVDIVKNETSFKWQLLVLLVFGVTAWMLPVKFIYSSILFISLFLPLLAEVANSSIERVVDLVTMDYHIMAKKAKDTGATLVLLSFIVTILIWIFTLLIAFKVV